MLPYTLSLLKYGSADIKSQSNADNILQLVPQMQMYFLAATDSVGNSQTE